MRARAGYTLLEVMLAIAIGLLLVAALYIALDIQLRYVQQGRDAVAEGQLARGVLTRMSGDVRLSLAQLQQNQTGTSSTTTTSSLGGFSGLADFGLETLESTTGLSLSTSSSTGQYNLGLVGSDTQMALYLSGVQLPSLEESEAQTGTSDLRRITYYLVPRADPMAAGPGEGLARQEVRNLAAGESLAGEGPVDILASEVVDLRFRYFSPSTGTWATSWSGSTTGPPLAVEITIWLQTPVENSLLRPTTAPPRQYTTIVAIPTGRIPTTITGTTTTTESSASPENPTTGGTTAP